MKFHLDMDMLKRRLKWHLLHTVTATDFSHELVRSLHQVIFVPAWPSFVGFVLNNWHVTDSSHAKPLQEELNECLSGGFLIYIPYLLHTMCEKNI